MGRPRQADAQSALGESWAEVGYWVPSAARGRGVPSAALGSLTGWSFDELCPSIAWSCGTLRHDLDRQRSEAVRT
jgi:RimJ/RimL family protein N-acetyltransferase